MRVEKTLAGAQRREERSQEFGRTLVERCGDASRRRLPGNGHLPRIPLMELAGLEPATSWVR
jgi:hypothetical protein